MRLRKIENDNALDAVKKSGKTTVYYPTTKNVLKMVKTLQPVQKEMKVGLAKT